MCIFRYILCPKAMELAKIAKYQNPRAPYERVFNLRINEILKACQSSKNLMIGIYLVEQDQFLYANNCLKSILGEHLIDLLEAGWDFWLSRIASDESQCIKDRLSHVFSVSRTEDPLTLRYHLTDYLNNKIYLKHEILLRKISGHTLAINYFFDVTEKERLELCFDLDRQGYRTQGSEKAMYISAREKEVLKLIADGFSSKEIADMLFISNHTAISHRKNLIEKFQVKNTAHLVKKASEHSYL